MHDISWAWVMSTLRNDCVRGTGFLMYMMLYMYMVDDTCLYIKVVFRTNNIVVATMIDCVSKHSMMIIIIMYIWTAICDGFVNKF